MKVERLATDGLIPYARNAKKHDDAQVAQSPAYVAVALERWHQHTGQTPVLMA